MTPAKMFDGDLWVLASDVMQLAENAYKNGQTDEREACAKFFDLNDTNMFWGSQAARHIRARGNA